MNLLALGCSYRTTPVEVRERLAFTDEQLGRALDHLSCRLGQEAVILSTCNRVELYLAPRPGAAREPIDVTCFLAEFHGLAVEEVRQHLYLYRDHEAVHHLFRVAA